jgi:two-component system invasion response regulator UvrY
MLNILVVDDHPSFRRRVKEILTEELNPVTIEEAGEAQEMLELVRRKKWDLIVMDILTPPTPSLSVVHG